MPALRWNAWPVSYTHLDVYKRQHHMIEVEEDVCDGQAQQGNEHEVVRIGEGWPAGSEGCQNFRKEKKLGNHQHHSGNQTHDEDVAKRTLSSFLVFSSQPDGQKIAYDAQLQMLVELQN